MALKITDILTRAGHEMWRELPEEYRYRDTPPQPGEPGDLAAFLHGLGHLLDLIRGTSEQLYADSFAEMTDARSGGREIQGWLLPYLADLVGAELLAPDKGQRVDELNASVRWYKSKGTVTSVDEVSDVITGVETVAREGWRRMLICPRIGLPPFTLPPEAGAGAKTANGQPRVAYADDPIGRAAMPLGCPDFRRTDRAVSDPGGSNPLYRITQPARDPVTGSSRPSTARYWRPLAPEGVPCFPGAFDDHASRMPDLRDHDRNGIPGPHPRRTIIHVRPPDGLFEAGLKVVTIPAANLSPTAARPNLRITPREALALGNEALPPGAEAPDRVVVRITEDILVASGRKLDLEGILLVGQVTPQGGSPRPARIEVDEGGRLVMARSAARRVLLKGMGPNINDEVFPSLEASDSLFGSIGGGAGHARLVYCTVMGETDVVILQASDSILDRLTDNLNCAPSDTGPATCLRYSRATPPPQDVPALKCLSGGGNVTQIAPRFAARWYCAPHPQPGFRQAFYGEPGYGVLDALCPAAIRAGAEDEGEMGAHHHQFHAAELVALARKLSRFLPLGQEVAIFHDPHLAQTPPELTV